MSYALQHVSVPSAPGRLPQSRAFYAETLGLREIPAPETITELDVIWFALDGGAELHVYDAPDDAASALRHFCLVADDLNVMRRRLEDAGVAVWDSEPIRGRPRFFCSDPAGNSIEFTSIEADYRRFQDS